MAACASDCKLARYSLRLVAGVSRQVIASDNPKNRLKAVWLYIPICGEKTKIT